MVCCIYLLTVTIGAVVLNDNPYSEGTLPSLVNSLSCDGTEEYLLECNTDQPARSCGRYEDAGVVCQGNAAHFSSYGYHSLAL